MLRVGVWVGFDVLRALLSYAAERLHGVPPYPVGQGWRRRCAEELPEPKRLLYKVKHNDNRIRLTV